MEDQITKIKTMMTEVSTGVSRIQQMNDEYKTLYREISDYCKEGGIQNPNPYSDLWEFYSYWSKELPTYGDRRSYIIELYKKFGSKKAVRLSRSKVVSIYINNERIKELKTVHSTEFDFKKLIRLCEEINIAYDKESYLSVIILLRAILDHIPPVFGHNNFSEVCGQYGKKSFKEIASRLNESSRKIADSYLHDPIRKKETLPNKTQVDFSQEIDYILAELISLI